MESLVCKNGLVQKLWIIFMSSVFKFNKILPFLHSFSCFYLDTTREKVIHFINVLSALCIFNSMVRLQAMVRYVIWKGNYFYNGFIE